MRSTPPSSSGASRVAGAILQGTFAAVARLRPTKKPLHPRGDTVSATIRRTGLSPGVGVPWIDEAGVEDVVVRISRAIGLPAAWPDIRGMAIRVPIGPATHGDLLFATTGRRSLGRFVLVPARTAMSRTYSTLFPYRTASGPLLLAARPDGPDSFTLACASPRSAWRTFGRLKLEASAPGDSTASGDVGPSFDPVLNQIPGLDYYPWAGSLREGSYRAARRSRRDEEA
jgi:hypothetical protein